MSDWFDDFGFGRIEDGLLTGAFPLDAGDVGHLRRAGVTAVVNLCDDLEYEDDERPDIEAAYAAAAIREFRLASEDHGHLLPGLIEQASGLVLERMEAGDVVYVHCRAGWQRSAAIAAAALARRDAIAPDEALRIVRRAREKASPLRHQVDDLRRWWAARAERG